VDYQNTYNISFSAAGQGGLAATVPSDPSLAGLSWFWQAWIENDPVASGQGWTCSNGLETVLGY
jgi:hypothetical protein